MTAEHAALNAAAETPAQSSAHGSSFYSAMRIMPPAQRKAMYEIYHYCRTIDDIADEESKAFEWRLEQLAQWRANINALYNANVPAHLHGLAQATKEFDLQREDFLAVIDGMEMDVRGPIQAPDMATLTLYCDRVACAVGRLSVRVFGMDHEDGVELAHHLGMALQLTNILRDIDEDAGLGRLYLPKDLLQKACIKEKEPTRVVANPAIAQVCSELADKATQHFNNADSIMKRCERKRVRTPRIMSHAYHAILTALIERGFASPRAKVHLSKIKLGYILMCNVLF